MPLYLPMPRWLGAHEARAQLRLAWSEFFAEWDVLLMPVAPTPVRNSPPVRLSALPRYLRVREHALLVGDGRPYQSLCLHFVWFV
jgi:hypothetical protein